MIMRLGPPTLHHKQRRPLVRPGLQSSPLRWLHRQRLRRRTCPQHRRRSLICPPLLRRYSRPFGCDLPHALLLMCAPHHLHLQPVRDPHK